MEKQIISFEIFNENENETIYEFCYKGMSYMLTVKHDGKFHNKLYECEAEIPEGLQWIIDDLVMNEIRKMNSAMNTFKTFVLNKCREWNIESECLYFSQMQDGYYADYKPAFPEKSNADFTISEDIVSGKRKIYGNLDALIPTIKEL